MRCRPQLAAARRRLYRTSGTSALALLACAAACAGPAGATGYVDGISDQSLPAWDGSFASSRFAALFRERWSGRRERQITLARYVVQWNAMSEGTTGPHATGNYRERFEAWLLDVRSLGLTPVLALTSYDGVHPASPAEYRSQLQAILAGAAALGYPIADVEPWNEPNGQGHESALAAAQLADAAASVCAQPQVCSVIAGDFEDRSSLPAFEQAYERALTFTPSIWGVHPYVSVRAHNDARLRRLIRELPAHGAGQRIWFTEVGALYCAHGEVRGQARQASDASYLTGTLLADPGVAPEHAFYYGFLFGGGAQAPCTPGGGEDSELYSGSDQPRLAAHVILRSSSATTPAAEAAAGEWPPWSPAASAMIEALPDMQGRNPEQRP
jgi:hypothetical protein